MNEAMIDSGLHEIRLHIGGVHASRDPIVIKTLLGSCVSVCLFDGITRIGGMNHFMLPASSDRTNSTPGRFGTHAMHALIDAMLELGAVRHRMVAKIFGGGYILPMGKSYWDIPQRNCEFARQFLAGERYPILAEDTGGDQARILRFHTNTGQVFVKRLGGNSVGMTREVGGGEGRTKGLPL